jgi:hypothetical protein
MYHLAPPPFVTPLHFPSWKLELPLSSFKSTHPVVQAKLSSLFSAWTLTR